MKKHIKTYLSIILVLSMLLSMLPIYAAATDDEFEGLEIVEEIPFEFELEPGDLPLDVLANAVLPSADLPAYISASLAAERDHVNRLYLQEPDANTVMFQNRDGSKTIYVFSKPVKNTGLTLGTNALAVNGGKIAFSGNNIITNRIGMNAVGKQIQDYKIGYSDIQTLPGGILTANGIDITEDVRNWAVSEYGSAYAEYTISDSASAAYNASVSVIETELMANAGASASANAVTPGITITPIDPSPATGATVMSITYSDLAGKMCFKNAETNKYLTLHPTTKNSLITTNNISGGFSYWIVKFVGTNKYTICSYYDRPNKYLGTYGEEVAMAIEPLNVLDEPYFSINIVSSTTNTVEILCYHDTDYALSSNGDFYDLSMDSEIPTSCHWIITNRSDYVEVQSITPQGTQANIRTVMAGLDFYPLYTTNPTSPTESEIRLYYADINQELPYGGSDDEEDEDAPTAYCISNTGTYTVYYKDNLTGVKSANFTIRVVTNVTAITPSSTTRVEQKSVPFAPYFATTPLNYVVYDINLYYADDDDETEDVAVSKNADGLYYINNAGVYIVYYKDEITGVRSENFTLIIYVMSSFKDNSTYSIQPANNTNMFLTMELSSTSSTSNNLVVSSIEYEKIKYDNVTETMANNAEKWDDISRTFTFESIDSNNLLYYISATLTTTQYNAPNVSNGRNEFTNTYTLVDEDNQPVFVTYDTTLSIKTKSPSTSQMMVICVGDDYYYIVCGMNSSSQLLALKYDGTLGNEGVSVEVLDPNNSLFRWKITEVGVDVPLIKQTRDYVCGYTTLLQVLMGADLDVVVNPSYIGSNGDTADDLDAKMKTLANIVNTVQYEAHQNYIHTYINNLKNNSSIVNNNKLDSVTCSLLEDKTDGEYADAIDISLKTGFAPWIFTTKAYSPYTRTNSGAHYMAVVGICYSNDNNNNNDYVIVSNCHYYNEVFGIYAVPFLEFCGAIEYLYCFAPQSGA